MGLDNNEDQLLRITKTILASSLIFDLVSRPLLLQTLRQSPVSRRQHQYHYRHPKMNTPHSQICVQFMLHKHTSNPFNTKNPSLI